MSDTTVGAGGAALDAANILNPALVRETLNGLLMTKSRHLFSAQDGSSRSRECRSGMTHLNGMNTLVRKCLLQAKFPEHPNKLQLEQVVKMVLDPLHDTAEVY
ncbi:hypothetical protein NE237_015242 [Protea cynaroides]|uniref:Uncharacterized protein n=1 Tax=Protea cynaroides TaxID=273540 RepID=A0A9Q0KDW4_9MAGN|nr:hypothetical protein NE237_015242 [Protea cynaroides]